MSNYKQDITLNEKDSLVDMLILEKELVKIYALCLTEGCSLGFRKVVEENFTDAVTTQFDVFTQMTAHDYYRVHSAPEEQTQAVKNSFSSVKRQISS